MSVNQHWHRWILASLSEHFTTLLGTAYPLYIEGQHRDDKLKVKDFLELRLDGPYFTELSKGYWRVYVEISILVQCTKDDKDYHRLSKALGKTASMYLSEISCFRYGSDTSGVDDQSYLGCLILLQDLDRRERIQVNNFGQIDATTQLEQGSVEAHYEMFLSE